MIQPDETFHDEGDEVIDEIRVIRQRGEGSVLGNMGIAYAGLGEAGKAITLLEQALKIGRSTRDISEPN